MFKINPLQLEYLHRLRVVQAASAIAILVGVLVLLGWFFDLELLKRSGNNLVTMKPNAALGFLLSGLSLWLLQMAQGKKDNSSIAYLRGSRICAAIVTLIGLLTLSQYLFGWNLGIDELLFTDKPDAIFTSHPGRMGFNTALNFILVGIALEILAHPKNNRSCWYVQILALIAALISLQVVISYAYKVQIFSRIASFTTSMALHTGLTFIVLCVGILWARPDKGLMQVVMSDTYGGLIARRLLLAAIAIPLVLGWLILQGQLAGKYGSAFALLLFAIILIIIFTIFIWQSSTVITRLCRQHDEAQKKLRAYEEKLRSFVDANVIGIKFGDVYGGIHEANEAFLQMIGYTREDLLTGRLSWRNITPPEHLYLDKQGIAEAQGNPNGACTPYEKEYIHKDGRRIPVLVGYVLVGENREESVVFILDLSERKQAKQQIVQLNQDLQRRIAELQTLFQVIPIGIGIAEDAECKTIRVNPYFAQQLGVSSDKNASLSATGEEKPTNFKVYREGRELLPEELPMQYSAAHGVEVLNFELDIVHQNGKVVKLLGYVAPLFDEDGNSRGSVGAFLDITERKQVEETIQNQQKWLENVLNMMPLPLLFIEPETGRVIFANRAVDELAGGEFPKGIPVEEYHTAYYCTDTAGNRIPNDQIPGARIARGERLDGLEMDWHTKELVRSIRIFSDTLPAMHGHPATCVSAFQDITNLKEIEKARTLNYKRLQLLFNTASDLLSSQQPLALIHSFYQKLAEQIGLDVYFNYLAEENSQVMRLASFTGISEEIAKEYEWLKLGQSLCGTVAQERHPIYIENAQQSTDPKTALIRDLGITAYYGYPLIASERLLGTLCFGSRSCSRFTENQRGMMQAVCDQIAIAMERASLITSLQQQTEQLREANRMKDEFLAILSHELRSPLNAILGWAQLLRSSRKFSDIQIAKAMETIERNAKTQTQLIEDLLDISRMMRGKLHLNVCTCNLVPLIESSIETVKLAAQAKEIDLSFSLIRSPEMQQNQGRFLVYGDIERLQQIIWNLLSNAIKFTPTGGKVEIRLCQSIENGEKLARTITSYAQIQVIDTGIGIKPEFLPYVFDRFRQADSSSTRSYGGLGLGLAIVHHLVELHGGTISVDSRGEEQGATFTVKLPLLLENQAVIPDSVNRNNADFAYLSPLPSLLGVRVLVVDDEMDTRDFITTVLQQCQAEVKAVKSVSEALQVILDWKPDVLVGDIAMPEEDGYSLIRKVRSQPPEQGGKIPAAALTAYARAEDRTRAIQEGYQLHLPKPIEPAELATVVASLVIRNS
ncbi:ATP-binding protein [Nodularia spumigena]|uniref:hybrid sensor histidine kinase/response regulator n=1 Tax=Nodularia spumigena TaxID=70799 RepID=UPI0023302895|nr:ATP-binding protein [Nodularia spumigena]MDB9339188.1 ATP-binding protein [Nodularia spumigena CS-589/07]MDB9355791.1 ATP-binding protein [Nodularia spumigena CS-587/03]MDB9501043.1 ATP-binding protein [Nodularia spumigena CS-336/02]MDB9530113.1 ATP-binding protein [Nodularia spumigena CS-1038]